MQASANHIVKSGLGGKLRSATLSTALLALLSSITISVQATELFMDTQTQQVFTSPGENRVKLSEFEKVEAGVVKTKLGEKGLEIETKDGEFKFGFGGRLQVDSTYHSNDKLVKGGNGKEANEGTEIRRGRIVFKGTLYKDFNFYTEADFADNVVGMKDLFLNYTGWDFAEITVGHQKQNISMELQESSNDIMFTERSLVNSLTATLFDRAIGIDLKKSAKDWSAQAGIYGDAMKSNANSDSGKADEGFGASTRVTFAPINTPNEVIHLGGFAGYRSTNGAGEFNDVGSSFSYETTHMSNLKLTDTGNIAGSDDATMVGLELAAMNGPFSIQSEYAKTKIQRENSLSSLDFDAFYVQAGWTLTGESRTYKGSDGEFKRLKPKNKFQADKPGFGALELAARYDQNDLTSKDIHGGEEKRATLALNWYLNESVRLMADYSRSFDIKGSKMTTPSGGQPGNIDILTFRTQLVF